MTPSIVVQTYDLTTGEAKFTRAIGVDPKSAEWLRGTIIWAINHNHGIQIFNEVDEALANRLSINGADK